MWTNEGRRLRRKAQHTKYARMSVVILAGLLFLGCGNDGGAPESSAKSAPDAPKASEAPMLATVADLFPEGAGRALVLENCGSCHAVACAAIGQRPAARWDTLKADHGDKVPSLTEQDRETLFAYLKAHFSDSQPEPKVSPDLLIGGCTPF